MALVVGVIGFLASAMVFGSTPDEEEFRFAVLGAWLRMDALRHGSIGLWTNRLGLGIPQPFTPAFVLHPLLPLLAIVSPVTWARALLVLHLLLGAAGMWQLARYLRLSAITTAVCISTFLLATPVQNYALTDFWPSHLVAWTSAPWLLWMAWRLLDADGRARATWSLALGIAGGLVLANTNPGHVLVYEPAVIAVAAARWRRVVPRWPWLGLAGAIALAIASPIIAQLLHERPLFDPALPKWSLPQPLTFEVMWYALMAPVGVDLEPAQFARTLFFGGPFLVLAAIGAVRFARRYADLVLIVVASSILLFTSVLDLSMLSARYQFRDPLTLAAIPLAGLALDHLFATPRWRRVAVAAVAIQLAVVYASAWPARARTRTYDARHAEWFRGATAETSSADVLIGLARPAGRLVFTPEVDEEAYNAKRLWEGLGENAFAYRGLPVVTGWFKGVSAGTIWPDERQLYARVVAPRALLESAGTLDVLGIRYVLAKSGEPAPAGFDVRGTVPAKIGPPFVLYENTDAWPAAFVLDASAEQATPGRLPGCENARVLCTDLSPLATMRSSEALSIDARDGDIRIRLGGASVPRLLVVTQMYREDWTSSGPTGGLAVVPVFGGLIGVRVPPGVTALRLQYRPTLATLTTVLSWVTLAASVATLLISAMRRVIL